MRIRDLISIINTNEYYVSRLKVLRNEAYGCFPWGEDVNDETSLKLYNDLCKAYENWLDSTVD